MHWKKNTVLNALRQYNKFLTKKLNKMEKTPVQMLIESVEYWNIKMDCPNLFKAICEEAINLENLETKLDDPLNKFIDDYNKLKQNKYSEKELANAYNEGWEDAMREAIREIYKHQ